MTTSPQARGARVRRPDRGPTLDEVQRQREWDVEVAASLQLTVDTAEKWRNGLAGLITVVLGVMLLKGPESVAKMASPWGYIVAVLLTLAVVLIVRGLWQAQSAAAPPVALRNAADISARHGSILAYKVAVADIAAARLVDARRLVAAGLAALVAAILAWGLAPTAGADEHLFEVTLDTAPSTVICGDLVSADGTGLRVDTGDAIRELLLADVTAIRTVEACEG